MFFNHNVPMTSTSNQENITIRDAHENDARAITAIYKDEVLYRAATFEEEPPTVAEITERLRTVRSGGLPYLVADLAGTVGGYAYVSAYRTRPAYRHSVENSVYVDPRWHRMGIGRALLQALIQHCEAGPWQQMIAVIGDSQNEASVALHSALGFRHVGTLQAVGFKHGRWVDTVLMQRALTSGTTAQGADVS